MLSSRSLRRCGLEDAAVDALARHNVVTVRDLLLQDRLTLSEYLGLSLPAVSRLLVSASTQVAPQPVPVSRLKPEALPTHLYSLDCALHGGLPCGAVTEVVGCAGLGKTQLCYTLAVINHRTRPPGAAVWIDTEHTFLPERLLGVAAERFPEAYRSDDALRALAEAVDVWRPQSAAELSTMLGGLEEVVIAKRVSLVLLDSVAAVVRRDFGARDVMRRQEWLGRAAAELKLLAEQFTLPVVVTNHVTAPVAGPRDGSAAVSATHQDEAKVVAALGNTWAHCVNVRLVLEEQRAAGGPQSTVRVSKAPMAANVTVAYRIAAEGVVEVPLEPPLTLSPDQSAAIQRRDSGGRFNAPGTQHATVVRQQQQQLQQQRDAAAGVFVGQTAPRPPSPFQTEPVASPLHSPAGPLSSAPPIPGSGVAVGKGTPRSA